MNENSRRIPQKYRHDVHVALTAVAALGPVGLLGDLDAIAIAGAWAGLLTAMFIDADIHLDKEAAKKLALAVIAGAGGYYAGCKLATKLFWLVPGAGIIMALGASTVANIIFTYRFAWVLAQMLEEKRISQSNVINIAGEIARNMTIGGGFNLDGVKDIYALYRNQ